MPGDSSAQWELRAVTMSVCLRYGVFVVLPTSNSLIITPKKYGQEKMRPAVHHPLDSLVFECECKMCLTINYLHEYLHFIKTIIHIHTLFAYNGLLIRKDLHLISETLSPSNDQNAYQGIQS